LQSRITTKGTDEVEYEINKTVKKVTEDIAMLKFNTAIASMMSFLNSAERDGITSAQYDTFLQILAPLAPHISEELWHLRGHKNSIHKEKWPKWSEKKLQQKKVTIAIQINGKLRGTLDTSPETDAQTLEMLAKENVSKWLNGATIKKIIVIPQKIVNIVI
jgi:leucyl-tRNA synthetase